MSLPFYKSSVTAANLFIPGASNSANTGLWYTRFYNAFAPDWSVGDEGKGNWIQRAIALGGTSGSGNAAQLKNLVERQRKLCSALSGTTALLETDASFVTGMGLSHPVENGFTFHPTLGVPYLPASGIKGVLRGWVEVWMEHDAATQQDIIARWFGAAKGNAQNKPEGAGNLIFFDALPTKPVHLACEIMTPHMGKWYEKGGEIHASDYPTAAPADWHAPVPVPFLVVKKGTEFEFMVAPRLVGNAVVDAQTKADMVQAMQELQNALEWMGAGSKTATGYGRMVDHQTEEEKAERIAEAKRAQALAVMTPQAKDIDNLRFECEKWEKKLPPNGNFRKQTGDAGKAGFFQDANKLVTLALASPDWSAVDKAALADMLEQWLPKVTDPWNATEQHTKLKLAALRGTT